MRLTNRKRAGFTLIELLVVIAILGLLTSITIGAVMRVRDSSEKRLAEGMLRKLDGIVRLHWRAVVDLSHTEWPGLANDQKKALLNVANGDERRAKMIYTKLRLKQEFPTSYYQALNPTLPSPSPNTTGVVLAPKLAFKELLAKLPINATPGWPASNNPISPLELNKCESSILMYVALQQSHGGVPPMAGEEIEANGIIDVTMPSPNGKPARMFIDPWGNPLRFYAFPYYCDELNRPPYVGPGKAVDPLDPEQTLTQKTRPPSGSPNPWNRTVFGPLFANQLQIHPVDRDLRYLTPVIASAGRDGLFGDLGSPEQSLIYMNLGGALANDNLYSFRLRQDGARGD